MGSIEMRQENRSKFPLYLKGLHQDSLGDVGEEGSGEFDVLIVSHDLLEPSQVVRLELHVQLII